MSVPCFAFQAIPYLQSGDAIGLKSYMEVQKLVGGGGVGAMLL